MIRFQNINKIDLQYEEKVTFTIWVMHLQIVSQKHLGKQVLDLLA